MSVKIIQKNPNWLKDVLKRTKGQDKLAIGYPIGTAGVSTKYPDGTPVLLVAAVNNFGSPSRGIPRRDFMTPGGAIAVQKSIPITAAMIPKLNAGKITRAQLLNILGPVAADAFKQAIVDLDSPANNPKTIKQKKSSNPLVDTGLLNQTLTFVVRE